jgi:hypothetical protein
VVQQFYVPLANPDGKIENDRSSLCSCIKTCLRRHEIVHYRAERAEFLQGCADPVSVILILVFASSP